MICSALNLINDSKKTNYSFCFSQEQKCSPCPYGADCSLEGDVVPLPNFFGYAEQTGQIIMVRCPNGYCCQNSSCQNINSCSDNRAGKFCGRCKPGFTEAIFSSHCVVNSDCKSFWFFGIYIGWIALGFTFLSLTQNFIYFVRQLMKWPSRQHQVSLVRTRDDKWFRQIFKLNSRTETMFKITPEPELPNSLICTFLLTAIFFYQDTSWLQVELTKALQPNQLKLQDLFFGISHWLLDSIAFSDSLCVWCAITPVPKLVLKMFVPLAILFIFVLFFPLIISVKTLSRQKRLSLSLASGFLVGILAFYQSITNTLFSLVSCIKIGETHVLHLDGSVECFQWWQILMVILIIVWVFPFIILLSIGPVFLLNQMITSSEIFLAFAFLFGFLMYWFTTRKPRIQEHKDRELTRPWFLAAVQLVQTPFKNFWVIKNWYLSWNGVLFSRRLLLVIVHAFISKFIWRLMLMFWVTFLFLAIHKIANPCTFAAANIAWFFYLLGSLVVSLANLVLAAIVESLSETKDAKKIAGFCDHVIDYVTLWIPLTVCLGCLFGHAMRHISDKAKEKKINSK